jgi:hypothetical protein
MKRTLTAIGLITLMLPLAACEKSDTDLVLDFVNSWLESRGAISKSADGSYKPTLTGVGVAMGLTTTGDEQADAAVQSGKMVKDIAENDKLVKEAEAANAKNPPDTKTAEDNFKKAINNRPDDWYYRNHRAYMYLDNGNSAGANADLKAGVDGCAGNSVCLAALHRDRLSFYTSYQASAFMAGDSRMRSNCPVYNVGTESYQALINMTTGAEQTMYREGLDAVKIAKSGFGC